MVGNWSVNQDRYGGFLHCSACTSRDKPLNGVDCWFQQPNEFLRNMALLPFNEGQTIEENVETSHQHGKRFISVPVLIAVP